MELIEKTVKSEKIFEGKIIKVKAFYNTTPSCYTHIIFNFKNIVSVSPGSITLSIGE